MSGTGSEAVCDRIRPQTFHDEHLKNIFFETVTQHAVVRDDEDKAEPISRSSHCRLHILLFRASEQKDH